MTMNGINRKKRVAHNFSAAAQAYDQHAELQRRVADSLLAQLPQQAVRVLDAGAGTGYALRKGWLGVDIAEEMCRLHPEVMVCGDMQQMPFVSAHFDGVFSSLAMQWQDEAALFLREAYRCTRLGGWLLGASFGQETLRELRQAFEVIAYTPPVLRFRTPDRLRLQLHRCGWNVEWLETEIITQKHDSVRDLLSEIKQLGARHKEKPAGGLRGKGWLQSLEDAYPRDAEGKVQSSWEVVRFKAHK